MASRESDIRIEVKDPHKIGDGVSSHIMYKIETHTSIREFGGASFLVLRRYSDFDWLHEQLVRTHPGIIIPPVPEKAIVGRFGEEFVKSRCRGLEKFLKRVASHPALVTDSHFRQFLTAGNAEFVGVKAAAKAAGEGGPGFLTWVASKSSGLFGGPATSKSAEDLSFEEVASYVVEMEPILTNVIRHSQGLIRRRRELANALIEFGSSFSVLGESEADAVGSALSKFGAVSARLAAFTNIQAEQERILFEEPVKEYLGVLAAAKHAMAYRDEKNAVLKQALADLDNKRANVMKLTGIPGKERQRAIAEDEVVKAQERVATTRAEYDAMARTVLKEIERFKQEKFQDFRQFLLDFVNLQIVYNKKLEAEWSSIITDAEAACGESSAAPEPAPDAGLPTFVDSL